MKIRYRFLGALVVMQLVPFHAVLANSIMGGSKEVIGPGLNRFQIVIKTDSMIVYSVTANNGKCKIDELKIDTPSKTETSPPLDADYGDAITVSVACDVQELEFQTNRGPITLHWK